jgi:hypothetical protein
VVSLLDGEDLMNDKLKPFEEKIESVNIGQPEGNPCSSHYSDAVLTWWWLRRIGFRFSNGGVDSQPHMIIPVNPRHDSSLEISPSVGSRRCWTVWLRSDIAHSRCRFVYVRDVETVGEIVRLIEAIGGHVVDVDFDADQFTDSLEREWRDCRRRYHEYANDARWGRIPGGL